MAIPARAMPAGHQRSVLLLPRRPPSGLRALRRLRVQGFGSDGKAQAVPWADRRISHPMLSAMAVAPFAAASLRMTDKKEETSAEEEDTGALSGIKKEAEQAYKKARAIYDRVYYGDVLPPVGSVRMSYARFLDLMQQRRVKRITVLGDGSVAIVEVPVEGWASETATVTHDRMDPEIMYAKQRPEWQMEKHRFYVELPGDFWESGEIMRMLKEHLPHRTAEGRIRNSWLLQEGQCTPELVVVDPSDQYVWLNQYAGQFIPIFGLILLRTVLGWGAWLVEKFGTKKKDRMQEIAEQYAKSPAKEFNVKGDGGSGKSAKSTGVSFDDVAGIDAVKNDILEVLNMMMGDDKYREMGARMPRGILLEGPPGTGKTYLAKAMAGEAGIPFFSANGAEFVEMFQGVAAARVRNLFQTARVNAPAIVFIDEIDAIGKARQSSGSDSGTQEREQGLLQLLQEMDGFSRLDKVLVIGATNRKAALDDALLRPGRFDRSIYMGMPSRVNRLKILRVHSRNKPISTARSEKWPEGDALLNNLADLTTGFSGAELANILNEAAILAVRTNKQEIDYETALLAMDKYKLGLEQPAIPDSPAKRHMANVLAGRAVVAALTVGMPPIENVSMKPRGGRQSRILFQPQEYGRDGDAWHMLAYGSRLVNAVEPHKPMATYEFLKGLLVPLYSARATEEVIYGRRGVTVATTKEMAKAGDLAHWLVRSSTLHPAFRTHAIHYSLRMGGEADPTTANMAHVFEELTLELQREAYKKAKKMVRERISVIKAIAGDLVDLKSATVQGQRIVELLKETPVEPVEEEEELTSGAAAQSANGTSNNGTGVSDNGLSVGGSGVASFQSGGDVSFRPTGALEDLKAQLKADPEAISGAISVATGNKSASEVTGVNSRKREEQMESFATEVGAPFPGQPQVPEVPHSFQKYGTLYDWARLSRPQPVKQEEVEEIRI